MASLAVKRDAMCAIRSSREWVLALWRTRCARSDTTVGGGRSKLVTAAQAKFAAAVRSFTRTIDVSILLAATRRGSTLRPVRGRCGIAAFLRRTP